MSAAPVPVTYGGGVYDRTLPLYTGEVRPEGVDLRYIHCEIEDLFWRQGMYAEFDASEYSMGSYLASVEKPEWPLIAIPVFPSRVFRHSAVYVRADAGIGKPADLNGRMVGTPEWGMTASFWIRGILGEHYGMDLRSIRWRTGGLAQPGRREKAGIAPPAGYDLAPIAADRTLDQALIEGEIDAIVSARIPPSFVAGDPRVRRLFADPRAEEREYFRKTGLFPIMHVVVLKKSLVAAHPWIANNLRNAFEQARRPAAGRLLDAGVNTVSLMWETAYAEEERRLSPDPFRYGVEENRAALEAMCRYAFDQGFTRRQLRPEDLFVPSTVTAAKI